MMNTPLTQTQLETAYREMAEDQEREFEADAWVEGLIENNENIL